MSRFVFSSLLAAVAAALAASPVSQGATFKIAGQTFTVPEGFEVERVAEPPLVDRPIEADFDEAGRLYVTDSSGSNDNVEKQLRDRTHRVLRLEDTDGDGRFDKRTVFADKLMFPEGCLWHDGSLYVAAPPSIWKLTDTNHDGVADVREEWHQGKTLTGCANDLHGPYAGPDGWIYWCKGAFAEQTYTLPGGQTFKSRAAHIFRKRPDGSHFEAVMTGGMDNPVEVAFTSGGERIFTTTFFQHPEAGRRDGLIHAIYGGLYGKPNDVLNDFKSTGELMPVLTHLGAAAPCGLIRYESGAFGLDDQDHLFASCFNLHKVTQHRLDPQGATFKTKDSDFLVSDSTDFHPTDVVEDADGSLLILDTGGWYKLCCPTSQLAKPDVLGAIYRVRRKGAMKIEDPRGVKVDWTALKIPALTALLGDNRPAVRRRAMQALARRGGEAVAELRRVLASGGPAEARRNAVWVLTRMDLPEARAAARLAFADRDESVRQVAGHSASVWRDARAFPALSTLLREGTPANRRVAAEALGRLGNKDSGPLLLSAVEQAGMQDRVLEHSLTFALIELGAPGLARLWRDLSDPASMRAALIAVDQVEPRALQPFQVMPFLASPNPPLKDAAFWVLKHHPEWGVEMGSFYSEWLTFDNFRPTHQVELERQLAVVAGNPEIQRVLSTKLNPEAQVPLDARLVVLSAMAKAGLRPPPAEWLADVARVLGDRDTNLVRRAVATAGSLAVPKAGSPELSAALLMVARNEAFGPELRLNALAAVRGEALELSPALFELVVANLDRARPVSTRTAAATVAARAKLGPAQLSALVDAIPKVGAMELPKVLSAFEKTKDEAIGLSLVSMLEKTKPSALRPDLVKPLLAGASAQVQQRGEALLKGLNGDAAKQLAHLEELLGAVKGGNIRRGQAVFNSEKAACSACHAIGYLGGKVGPDLTGIGRVRTERDLLEAIIYPSLSFVRSFEPVFVSTRSGEEYSGVLRGDTPEEVVLVTGPNSEVRVPRSDVAEMRPGTVSVMPQGLDDQLSRQELADLVAFLKDTK